MVKKKLCIFITRLISGGAQKIVVTLLKKLNREKYDLTLVIGKTPENEPHLLPEIPDDVRIIRLDSVVREISPIRDLIALWSLFRIFRKEKFDILHLHTSKAGVLGSISGYFAGIKNIIYTPHGHIFSKTAQIPGVSELPSSKKKILYFLRKIAYRLCTKLVALSEEDKNEQTALNLAAPEKFAVIMNGIDVDSFSGHPIKEGKDIVIGSVGRLSREKGHDVLIEAFAVAIVKCPDIHLLIVGDGKESSALGELAERLGVSGKVSFPGNTDDVRGFLKEMDIFVLPSRYESQGIAAMEAMSAGLPIIASNVGGIPGIITDNAEGLLVKPEDSHVLAIAIEELANDKALREKLASGGRIRAEKDFRVEKMLSAYETLYDSGGEK